MSLDPSKLRHGEVVAGASALLLLASVFLTPWYGFTGQAERAARAHGIPMSFDAWNSLTTVRWLLLVTIALTLLLVYVEGSRRAPAMPASLSVIVLVLAVVTAVVLVYRVLLSVPGPGDLVEAKVGAYLGLVFSVALVYGAFRSLRQEAEPDPARNAQIPTVRLRS